MKIKDGYLLRTVADTHVVVPIAERVIEFKGMMILNEVSACIWEFLREERGHEEVIEHILSTFDVDRETAEADFMEFLGKLENSGVLV